MTTFAPALTILWLIPLAPAPDGATSETPSVEDVCRLLSCDLDAKAKLAQMGDKAFPAFETILADATAEPRLVAAVLLVVRDVKADRRRFIEPAVRALAHQSSNVRSKALQLLAQIGTAREAPPVVALLNEGDNEYATIGIAFNAARTLVAIGGPSELRAMDVWLVGAANPRFPIRTFVKTQRDLLEKRLTEAAKLKR